MSGTGARADAYRWGLRAETICVWWLRAQGYRVLARRFNAGVGEIDIIAKRGRLLAMVEVKARRGAKSRAKNRDIADIADAAPTPRQRQRIARAAEAFLARSPAYNDCGVRFDLMVVRPWRAPYHLRDAWRP